MTTTTTTKPTIGINALVRARHDAGEGSRYIGSLDALAQPRRTSPLASPR